MKVCLNFKSLKDTELFEIFKSAFLYLNSENEYSFKENSEINFNEFDCTINLTLDYFPVKSIEKYLKQNTVINLEDTELVYREGNLFKANSDCSFIYFKYPIRELLENSEINSENAKYIHDLSYLIVFGTFSGASDTFINNCYEKIKLITSKKFFMPKSPLTYPETVTYKQFGMDIIFKSLGRLSEPKNRSLLNKNICFACVTSKEYTEPTYVFLHSMFKFNDIKLFKVYFVNGSSEYVEKFSTRVKKISKNIDVIQYNYHTESKTLLHFNRDYVDSKMSILDELTPQYDLTVMCDCDMLCQGNLKDTLMYCLIKPQKIFGVKDALVITSKVYNKSVHYINGGFIIYKKDNYNFEKRYDDWKCSDIPESNGMYNEQDFINYVFYNTIKDLSAVNNYTAHHKRIELNKPILYHFVGPTKPYQNIENSTCNTILKVVQRLYTPFIPETMFHEIYRNYVQEIKTELDPLFLKQIYFLKNSTIIKTYNELVFNKCLTVINEEN